MPNFRRARWPTILRLAKALAMRWAEASPPAASVRSSPSAFRRACHWSPNVVVTIDRTSVFDNRAQGGGRWLGGGNVQRLRRGDDTESLVVTENTGKQCSGVGLGVGGGVYNEGQMHQIRAMIFANLADIDDDCFGC